MEVIECIITDEEVAEHSKKVSNILPLDVVIRLLLESKGIKYKDSGKLSAIGNINPIPLGELSKDVYQDDHQKLYLKVTQRIEN